MCTNTNNIECRHLYGGFTPGENLCYGNEVIIYYYCFGCMPATLWSFQPCYSHNSNTVHHMDGEMGGVHVRL